MISTKRKDAIVNNFLSKLILTFFLCHYIADASQITIGQITNNFGEMQKYAKAITQGITACINETNKQGGIQGKKLVLKTENDNGNPILANKIVKKFIHEDIHFFLGCMGSRSVVSLIPEIENNNICMLFPWSGSKELRTPKLRGIINAPGLLKPQTDFLAEYLVKKRKIEKLGIFHADDSFSTEGKVLLEDALNNYSSRPVAIESYSRQIFAFKETAKKLLAAEPKAVVCLSTSMPAVKIIKNFLAQGIYNTMFFGIDSTFMVGDILKEMGIPFSYTSIVPDPQTSSLQIAKDFLKALKESAPTALPNTLSFTYYICTKIFVNALKKSSLTDNVSSSNDVLSYLESLKNYSLGGFQVNFDTESRHLFGSDIFLIKG